MKDTRRSSQAFTDEERAAMKERAQEAKPRRGAKAGKAGDEEEVLAKIAEMSEPDRTIGHGLHALVKAHAPALSPKLWYGMPAYARDGKVVLFFQAAAKFKARYPTLGFSDEARLDEGDMWPTSYALTAWSAAQEERVAALVRKAVSG
jgi:uncharacterized protein YdhG (YjbR/CyaY superfamily)